MEKFHFNWKMDSFTSWLGLLGRCSTTRKGCQPPLERGLQQESAPTNVGCSGTSEDNLVSCSGWLTWVPLLFLPQMSFNLIFLHLSTSHKGWVYFIVPLWHFFGIDPFPSQPVEEDQNLISSALWWIPNSPTSQTTSLLGTLLASSGRVLMEDTEHFKVTVTWLRPSSLPSNVNDST